MFAETIEEPQLKPGPAARKRKLTNLLSRIKIEMFGVESLEPDFVKGKDVRAMNTRLVEELIKRMLSERNSMLEAVFQHAEGVLDFYILLKEKPESARMSLISLILDYEMLDIAERYPVHFHYIRHERKEHFSVNEFRVFYTNRNATTFTAGKA